MAEATHDELLAVFRKYTSDFEPWGLRDRNKGGADCSWGYRYFHQLEGRRRGVAVGAGDYGGGAAGALEIGMTWPRGTTYWRDGRKMYASVPFTWNLPVIIRAIEEDLFDLDWHVGGPAVRLMPDTFKGLERVTIGGDMPSVLQRVNPEATRTTAGCPRACAFCGVSRIYPQFQELDDWPDLPILCDDNLLAASPKHFDRVMDRLQHHESCDFNQGLDCHLLERYHAKRLARLRKPLVRMALDGDGDRAPLAGAIHLLRSAGVAKSRIRIYVLIGFSGAPQNDWRRCDFVESFGLKALPMWYHALDATQVNVVTDKQASRGWSDRERKRIMGWYYKHRGTKPAEVS